MSKNFNLLYVFIGLLLLFFDASSSAATKDTALMSALKQRNQLIDQHGLLESPAFKQQCLNIFTQLKIGGTCIVIKHEAFNAFAFADGFIVITLGLLKETQNADQLAHILAHEHAHIKHHHHIKLAEFISKPPIFFPKKKLKKLRLNQENEADQFANKVLEKAQYDAAQIHHLWLKISSNEHKQKWSDHINLANRIDKESLLTPVIYSPKWLAMIHDLSQR